MLAMASSIKVLGTPNDIIHSRFPIHCLDFKNSISQINGMCFGVKEESKRASFDFKLVNKNFPSSDGINEGEKDLKNEKLEALWDDGVGNQTMKDYFELAKELIRHDGGPPRWFTPLSCGPPLKDSPILLFLPGKRSSCWFRSCRSVTVSEKEGWIRNNCYHIVCLFVFFF